MPLVTRYPSGQTPSGIVSVTDGVHTVNPATELDFTSGATVTDGGGGVAQVAISGGGGGGVQVATTDVSSAQILALAVTPVPLVAGVAGNVILVNGVCIAYLAGATPYTDGGGSFAVYSEAAVTPMASFGWASVPTLGFTDQAASQVFEQGYGTGGSTPQPLSDYTGVGVILEVLSGGAPTLGDGTLKVTVSYFLAPTA